ncbi:hypothetical protein ADK90_34600 [Streptomyces sp. XY413]|nr:SDR family oxidoreductase [Streptomyces sp. XY413]KOV14406.1 hypothetical protein ADK90_34600 [Streptomyces sp. XY413]
MERAVDAAVADIGRLGIAVNDAGYDGEYQLTRDYSADMLDRMIALNVRGGGAVDETRAPAHERAGIRVDREHVLRCRADRGSRLLRVRGHQGSRDRHDQEHGRALCKRGTGAPATGCWG